MQTQSSIERRDIVIGIDAGSTSVRVAVHFPDSAELEPLWNSETTCEHDLYRYEQGTWDATINISPQGPAWTGDRHVPTSNRVPAKLIISQGKGLDSDHQLYEDLRCALADPVSRHRCEEGPKDLFCAISKAIEAYCQNKHRPCRIVRIGLTMPAHWGVDEEERLVDLVRDNFTPSPPSRLGRWHDDPIDILVHTEAEAIAHFICHNRSRIEELSDDSTNKFALFLDFGGHCLNGCIFYLRRRKSNGVSFFRAEEPFAVVGGTEHWVARVGKFCCSNAVVDGRVTGDARLKPEVRNLLISRFRVDIRLHKADNFPPMYLRVNDPDTSEDIQVTISAESNSEFFREAFDETLVAAEEAIYRLQRMSNEQNAESLVIVTGGSGQYATVQSTLRRLCKKYAVPNPKFLYHNDGRLPSCNIARGAALATAQSINLHQFMERGAAFGLQELQAENYEMMDWDDKAEMLLSSEANGWTVGREIIIETAGMSRFKMICDPLWDQCLEEEEVEVDEDNTPYLLARHSYDLLDLLIFEAGIWRIRLSPCGERSRNQLRLERSVVSPGSLISRHLPPVVLTLYLVGASYVFLVKVDEDIHDLHCGVGLESDGTFVALTSGLEKRLRQIFWRRQAQYEYPGVVDNNRRRRSSSEEMGLVERERKRRTGQSWVQTCHASEAFSASVSTFRENLGQQGHIVNSMGDDFELIDDDEEDLRTRRSSISLEWDW